MNSLHITELILALCHITYNKSEGHYAVEFVIMEENQAVLLSALVALAIVSGLAGGSEQIAYAQIWDFASNIHNQNVDVNTLLANGTSVKNNNDKTSIDSNCVSVKY